MRSTCLHHQRSEIPSISSKSQVSSWMIGKVLVCNPSAAMLAFQMEDFCRLTAIGNGLDQAALTGGLLQLLQSANRQEE